MEPSSALTTCEGSPAFAIPQTGESACCEYCQPYKSCPSLTNAMERSPSHPVTSAELEDKALVLHVRVVMCVDGYVVMYLSFRAAMWVMVLATLARGCTWRAFTNS